MSSQLRDGHVEMPGGVNPESQVPRVDPPALEAASALGHRLVVLEHRRPAGGHGHFLFWYLNIRRWICPDTVNLLDADLQA